MQRLKTTSWGTVIAWSIFFVPVGIYFLYKMIGENKAETLNNAKYIKIISYILIAVGFIGLSGSTGEESSYVLITVVYVGVGIWLNIVGRKMSKDGKKYQKYVGVILNQGYTRIDDIAQAVGVVYSTAKIDLQKMIDSDYFIGAVINDSTREIVLSKSTKGFTPHVEPLPTHTVICKFCGGNNSVGVGKSKPCEYCGSSIE